jgi:hypothetical protein
LTHLGLSGVAIVCLRHGEGLCLSIPPLLTSPWGTRLLHGGRGFAEETEQKEAEAAPDAAIEGRQLMIFLKPVLTLTAMHCAVLLAGLPVDAAFGAQVDCRGVTDLLLDLHAQEEIALAQVTATEARVSFIANPGERMRDCPSAKSSCRLKAFLVPGDDVLVIARDGPYVCATFKSPQGVETSGWLPKAALAILAPKTISAQAWDGKWRDGVEAEIVLKSHGDEVEVSGEASWGGVHTGELEGNGKPRDRVNKLRQSPRLSRSSFNRPSRMPERNLAMSAGA